MIRIVVPTQDPKTILKPENEAHSAVDGVSGILKPSRRASIGGGGKAGPKANITVQVCVRVRPRIAKIDDAEEELALAKAKDGKMDRPGKLQVCLSHVCFFIFSRQDDPH